MGKFSRGQTDDIFFPQKIGFHVSCNRLQRRYTVFDQIAAHTPIRAQSIDSSQCTFYLHLCKGNCCRYSFELHRLNILIDTIMSNIIFCANLLGLGQPGKAQNGQILEHFSHISKSLNMFQPNLLCIFPMCYSCASSYLLLILALAYVYCGGGVEEWERG